jgi:hypothetical protein
MTIIYRPTGKRGCFNIFPKQKFKNLGVTTLRRTVPWNTVWDANHGNGEAVHEVAELEEAATLTIAESSFDHEHFGETAPGETGEASMEPEPEEAENEKKRKNSKKVARS